MIFIITDDESPTLGCYGDPVAKTPAINAVAADITIFLNAFATATSCSASRSPWSCRDCTITATGSMVTKHSYHKFESSKNVVTLSLPRVMANAGYRTGHIGKYHVAPGQVYRYGTDPFASS